MAQRCPIGLPRLFAGLDAGEALAYVLPVHHVPLGGEVVGPLVLVAQVVGVLPHVVAEQSELT